MVADCHYPGFFWLVRQDGKVKKEMIFVNFKTYQQGTGEQALSLAKICAEVASKTGLLIIPLVQTADIFRLASQGFTVWAQHVDGIDFGPHTGQTLPMAVLSAGAKGTLLNHAENKLSLEKIELIKQKCSGLQTLICAESLAEAKQIAVLKPDFLAYEPPELIGGKISVSQARPEIISQFIEQFKEIPVLVGAGIHNQADVKKALELGARGILVSSDVVLADNPKQELFDLAGGFKQ